MSLHFIFTVFLLINAVAVVTILMIHMLNDAFLMLLKNMNIKVFNIVSRTNETRHVSWHETCRCKCRLDASVCNNKQRWNNGKCRCECK